MCLCIYVCVCVYVHVCVHRYIWLQIYISTVGWGEDKENRERCQLVDRPSHSYGVRQILGGNNPVCSVRHPRPTPRDFPQETSAAKKRKGCLPFPLRISKETQVAHCKATLSALSATLPGNLTSTWRLTSVSPAKAQQQGGTWQVPQSPLRKWVFKQLIRIELHIKLLQVAVDLTSWWLCSMVGTAWCAVALPTQWVLQWIYLLRAFPSPSHPQSTAAWPHPPPGMDLGLVTSV